MSIGSGYDQSLTTLSPDGRVFQVEYACKAVDNAGTAVGLCCKDGVVLGLEKLLISKMLVKGTNRAIHHVAKHIGMATAGLKADGRALANEAQGEASEYLDMYGSPIPAKLMAERFAGYVHTYTLYYYARAYGCATLMAVVDEDGPALWAIEADGECFKYYGYAVGKAKQQAKTMISALDLETLTCREAVVEIAKIINTCHDELKDKQFELEMSWICEETGNVHKYVPAELIAEATAAAKAAMDSDSEDDA